MRNNTVVAIIVAAGKGNRLDNAVDKPFVQLNKRPIVLYSLLLFEKIAEISSVILVVSKERLGDAKRVIDRFDLGKVRKIVEGGSIRQESVSNGLKALSSNAEIVLVHDAARPLVSAGMVKRLIVAGEKKATVPVWPVSDTLKEIKKNRVLHTLDRSRFYAVQTPQSFPRKIILTAYRQAKHFGTVGTDDAALVERSGFPVQAIKGERTNIKITYPEDLLYAETILKIKTI